MVSCKDFPVGALLPKKETGVLSFLTKYPEYDGRGTVLAILDSGVDPGAPGLQLTTDGRRKVIHRFDCSGCGDVSTSTVVKPAEGLITGLSGRILKIPKKWNNPTNTFRVGLKHAFDLYPEPLREQMRNKYKEKKWDETHREIVANVNRKLAHFDKSADPPLSDLDRMKKEDAEAELEILNNFEKKFSDPGPLYDCVLFHDGKMWKCCVDTSEEGHLDECPLLGEYSLTGDFAPLTKDCNLNISFNVHDDGDTLELVGLCSVHGTLVAAIAAGNFPDKPEENGVAPGAQIVSLTIGDGRLGSMETGTALVRAIIKIMELSKTEKIDVINMSYGEHAHWSDDGRIGELMNEVVVKYGITWVASAGNHGPALNTIGTPPDISQDVLIGVGAYVSPEMMVANYSLRQKLPGMSYTWSSRGPAMDGAMGVTVCAPGGAIASCPTFTLRYSQLCNGTSMSSPHTAGAVCLLISGLLSKELPYSPFSIKRAIEESATFLPDTEVFVQGSGLLNVEKTFDHLTTYYEAKEINVRFQVACGPGNTKGIFIRNRSYQSGFLTSIVVEPVFVDTDNVPAEVKINFNIRLALLCDAQYVSCPTHLDLSNTSRTFALKIDLSSLSVGVHSTFIRAYDVGCVQKGALFRIPITIIIPEVLEAPKYTFSSKSVLFKPNTIKRFFIHPPKYSTCFRLRMSTKDEDLGRFVVHVLQLTPRQSCRTLDSSKIFSLNSDCESVLAFKVRGEGTIEIVIAKYWASIGDMSVDFSVQFRGMKPNRPSITMHAADGVQSVCVTTLGGEELSPAIVLKNSVQVLRASEAKISALSKRDVVPPSRQIYELVLTYNFSLSKAAEVTPDLSIMSDVLYESEYESQLWMVFDNNKQLISCGDAYPSKYSFKVEKGDYVLRAQIRHEKREYLDKLCDTNVLLQQKLSNPINLDVHTSYSNAVTSGKKVRVWTSMHASVIPFYIAPIPLDKLPSKNNGGQFLTGCITYVKDEAIKKIDDYPFRYVMNEIGTKKCSSSSSSDKSKAEELNDAIRDLKIQWLPKLDPTNAEKCFEELAKEYPFHVLLHATYITSIDTLEPKTSLPNFKQDVEAVNKENLEKLIACCDNLIELIDAGALLTYIATKTDVRSDSSKIKSSMDQKKNGLMEALAHKGIALCRMYINDSESKPKDLEFIEDIWKNLGRFYDLTDTKCSSLPLSVIYFLIWHSWVNRFYGKAFKYLLKLQEEKPCRETEDKIMELSGVMEWTHVQNYVKRLLPSKFVSSYKPF